MTDDALLRSLKQALDRDPRNGPLWRHYADLLAQAGRRDDAIGALRTAVELLDDDGGAALRLVALLREAGQLAEALIRAEALHERAGSAGLSLELGRILRDRGEIEQARRHYAEAQAAFPAEVEAELAALGSTAPAETVEAAADLVAAPVVPENDDDDWASQFDWEELRLTFADVAGLDEVKRQIRLRVIAPFQNPGVYRAFRRQSGGGLLLYGPPGCGKTFVARATAGECGARFVCVSIHDVVDKYWGESEKMVHALFEEARRSPTVLFFDEFDALGSSRGRGESQFWKVLVNQLLQEMDGMRGRNDDVLVFAATNMPWSVDPAFRRPGRFDRVLFVPPPDAEARTRILHERTKKLPGAGALDLRAIAARTELFTGADLVALAERAAERALELSLESGRVEPVTQQDFLRELPRVTSSAHEWLATARNYAKYGNEGGQYDELRDYLERVKKW